MYRSANTGREDPSRAEAKELMLNGLIQLIPTNARQSMRRIFTVAGVFGIIGLAGIGSGRTLEQKLTPSNSAPQSALHSLNQPAAVELMHDIRVPAIVQPKTRTVMMEVTAYCACVKCCGPNAIGLTASGKDISYNSGKFVAADTSVLPFGTKLIIPGYHGQAVEVIDRGGAIKGNKLDVFFPTHQEALVWGRQHVAVTVVE